MHEDSNDRVSYRVSKDVLTAQLEGEAVLLHMKTKQYYRLNETGAAIWKGLERGWDTAAIVDSLVRDFDVEADVARAELGRVIDDLKQRELLEP